MTKSRPIATPHPATNSGMRAARGGVTAQTAAPRVRGQAVTTKLPGQKTVGGSSGMPGSKRATSPGAIGMPGSKRAPRV